MMRIAYHRSGSYHEKFSSESIGRGEGNQAYGYGLCFTDSEEIADLYKEKLEPDRFRTKVGNQKINKLISDREKRIAN